MQPGFVIINLLILMTVLLPGCTNTDRAEVLCDQGIGFNNHAQYDQALESLNKSLEFNPHSARAWLAKGITLYNMKRFDAAGESIDNALALDPGSSTALLVRGEILSAGAKTGEAGSVHGPAEIVTNTTSQAGKKSVSNLYVIPAGTLSLFRE
jgi:tetratricopeptide (TPR) repeat protein